MGVTVHRGLQQVERGIDLRRALRLHAFLRAVDEDEQPLAGRYITDNVYSGLEVAPAGKSRVTLTLDRREGVTVKGSVDSEGQSGLGIYIEKDY